MSPASISQITDKNQDELDASSIQISNKNPEQLETISMSVLRSPIRLRKCSNLTTVAIQQGNLDYGLILPREIWFCIGKRLESRLDVSRFRSVCRTWRSVLPPPLRFPLRVPPPPRPGLEPDEDACGHFITELTFYTANDDMIVLFEEEHRGGGFSASAIVHKSQITPNGKFFELPPVAQIPSLSFLCKAYHVHDAYPREINGKRVANKWDFNASADVLKIAIICSDGSTNINPNYPRLRHLTVVAHLAVDRKLAVLRLGGGAMNNNWETGFCGIAFDDIINYRGRLYAVESSGRAFVMDYDSLRMTQVAPALSNYQFAALSIGKYSYKWKLMHLAVVSGDLYMFVHEYKQVNIVVPPGIPKLYKLSLWLGTWVEADQDLPGQVFIANMLCNFPVSRELFRGGDKSRSYSWPQFEYVRVAVGFKADRAKWRCRSRSCDHPCGSYYYPGVSGL